LKIATYNVYGVKGRMPRLLAWLEEARPDIACLQEIKTGDATFPHEPLEAAGDAVLQPQTRTADQELLAQGWTDSARHLHPTGRKELYTFWVNDQAFQRGAGFRMDFLLLSPGVLPRLRRAVVDFEHRGREKPSDHAPVWVELA
jgi:exonuclease III